MTMRTTPTTNSDQTSSTSTSLNYIKRIGTPIAALASGLGGPVSIIRVSGSDLGFLSSLMGSLPKAGEHALRKLRSSSSDNGSVLDEALVLYFQAPHSFTGENVVEIQGHGVASMVDAILEELYALGCEKALPGEFSFRAVWNEKMTLEEASRLQMLFANEGLDSSSASKLLTFSKAHDEDLKNLFEDCLSNILSARGRVEAAIDFSEAEEEQAEDIAGASEKLKEVQKSLIQMQNAYDVFARNSHVPTVILAGKPNSGKSTLLNILCGSERSLVSSLSGTTRDYIEVSLKTHQSRSFKLLDTAGLRELQVDASEENHAFVEQKGVEKAWSLIESADILFWLYDLRDDLEKTLVEAAVKEKNPSLHVAFLGSHADLSTVEESETFSLVNDPAEAGTYVHSVIDGFLEKRETGLQELDETKLVSQRQRQLIDEVLLEITRSQECLSGARPLELVGEHLRKMEFYLKQVIGQDVNEDYIGEIFSQFCLGK